jgi:hypothetical protein
MPIIRVDVPEGQSREKLLDLRHRVRDAVARTWAKEHIYVAMREIIVDPGECTIVVTVDLRGGRGYEEQRAAALYREILHALRQGMKVDENRFVLLIREFPERCFVVSGGQRLPPLEQITPELAEAAAGSV